MQRYDHEIQGHFSRWKLLEMSTMIIREECAGTNIENLKQSGCVKPALRKMLLLLIRQLWIALYINLVKCHKSQVAKLKTGTKAQFLGNVRTSGEGFEKSRKSGRKELYCGPAFQWRGLDSALQTTDW